MKIQLLYVPDCPFHAAALKLLKDVLASEGIEADIDEVLVSDQRTATELSFRGSPTILINGRDVESDLPTEQPFALCCRFYAASTQPGLPPRETIHRAVLSARGGGRP